MNIELHDIENLPPNHCILVYCVKYKSERYEYSRKTYMIKLYQNGQLGLNCINNDMSYFLTEISAAPNGLLKVGIRDDVLICRLLAKINTDLGKIEPLEKLLHTAV